MQELWLKNIILLNYHMKILSYYLVSFKNRNKKFFPKYLLNLTDL